MSGKRELVYIGDVFIGKANRTAQCCDRFRLTNKKLPSLILHGEFVPPVQRRLSLCRKFGGVCRVDADSQHAVFFAQCPGKFIEARECFVENNIAQQRAFVVPKDEYDGAFTIEKAREQNVLPLRVLEG